VGQVRPIPGRHLLLAGRGRFSGCDGEREVPKPGAGRQRLLPDRTESIGTMNPASRHHKF